MNKRKRYTAAGILLSFIIAIGGWILTGALIDQKSNTLLAATGILYTNTPSAAPGLPANAGEEKIRELLRSQPRLSESDMFLILQTWEADGYEQPHEPFGSQLSMENAIYSGVAFLSYFYEQGMIPDELLEYEKTTAYLFQNIPRSNKSTAIDTSGFNPNDSYWVLSFASSHGNIWMKLHAVTGQVWKAEMRMNHADTTVMKEIPAAKALDIFTAYLGLTGNGSYMMDKTTAYKSFAHGRFYAITRSTFTEKNEKPFLSFYLTTRTPDSD